MLPQFLMHDDVANYVNHNVCGPDLSVLMKLANLVELKLNIPHAYMAKVHLEADD